MDETVRHTYNWLLSHCFSRDSLSMELKIEYIVSNITIGDWSTATREFIRKHAVNIPEAK